MESSAFIDFNSLSREARKELQLFYEYLKFKYEKKAKGNHNSRTQKKRFTAIQLDTLGFEFNREEANER